MSSKVPDAMIRKPQRRIRDLATGESGHLFGTNGVHVTSDGSAFLDPDAVLTAEDILKGALVTRDDAGYHVIFPNAAPLDPEDEPSPSWIPVESVGIGD